MKPISLKLTAFGPYKNTETINFTDLKANRLFVVSGKTGAGKTTIFDGICFALYGSASGEDRNDSKLLRSDFAEDDVHTAAELEFELHGRLYRILRQLGHVKQGNKGATGERYEFYEKVANSEVPCVDRQIVTEINQKVESLIGLSREQFSQIVMLPQGEFRKLLTSQTENKEEILRRIFKTEPYKLISERLKEKKKLAEESYKLAAQHRNNYITSISATLPEREQSSLFNTLIQEHYNVNQVIDGLSEEVFFYENKIILDEKEYHEAYQTHNKKQTEYHQAKALNERFVELKAKEEKLNNLTEQLSIFKEKETYLLLAEQASHVELYERQFNDWRESEEEKKKALVLAEGSLKKAIQLLEEAAKTYEQEEEKQVQREQTSKELDKLNDYFPIVKELDQKKQELSSFYTNVTKLKEQLDSIESKVQKKKELKEKLHQEVKELDAFANQLPDKKQQLTEMRDQYKKVDEFIKQQTQVATLHNELNSSRAKFERAKASYAKLENAWINGQAIVLATHLQNGQPCPVCGSTEHPNKQHNQENTPTKAELDKAKQELDIVDSDYRSKVAKYDTLQSQLEIKKQELEDEKTIEVDDIISVREKLMEKGKQLKLETDKLQADREKLLQLRKNLESLEKELDELEAERQKQTTTYNDQKTIYSTNLALYQEKVQSIPEDVRVLTQLEHRIQEMKKLKENLARQWELAQQKLQFAKQEQTKAETNLKHAKSQVEEVMKKKESAQHEFQQALSKAKFSSVTEYQQAKLSEQQRQTLKTEIDEFNQTISLLKEQVIELNESLKGKQIADLTELSHQMEKYRQAYETALNKWNQSKEFYKEAMELKINIIEANEKVTSEEDILHRIADLYDVMRGQNNSKISFERYLQIEYLEQIIFAANERLKRLSNGQFHLMRSDRMESRGRQSGLGLDVYDAYTGQTRDVKTLSGGEKFNASLCLALGLADVIQSFQGGVSIDTMFIDEGFGSLDEESLNNAIDTLIDLQKSGRMIGVISHVQELKTAIPAILQVEKTKEGYSRTEFIVN